MNQETMERLRGAANGFRLPRYHEIPTVGLYLEQVVKYINDCFAPLLPEAITGAMVSNYVKRGLVDKPVKKQYSRDQIAYLIYIAIVKTVLSIDDIKLMISIQRRTYSVQVAYDYVCMELENMLDYVFGRKATPDNVGVEHTNEKIMLRSAIITASHKIYLDRLFDVLKEQGGA